MVCLAGRQNLGCVVLAVPFNGLHLYCRSQSDLLHRLNCHVDKQPAVGDLFLLDSRLLETAIEESKSHHNSTIKLLIKIHQFYFKMHNVNIALSLHCSFQALIFSDHGEN